MQVIRETFKLSEEAHDADPEVVVVNNVLLPMMQESVFKQLDRLERAKLKQRLLLADWSEFKTKQNPSQVQVEQRAQVDNSRETHTKRGGLGDISEDQHESKRLRESTCYLRLMADPTKVDMKAEKAESVLLPSSVVKKESNFFKQVLKGHDQVSLDGFESRDDFDHDGFESRDDLDHDGLESREVGQVVDDLDHDDLESREVAIPTKLSPSDLELVRDYFLERSKFSKEVHQLGEEGLARLIVNSFMLGIDALQQALFDAYYQAVESRQDLIPSNLKDVQERWSEICMDVVSLMLKINASATARQVGVLCRMAFGLEGMPSLVQEHARRYCFPSMYLGLMQNQSLSNMFCSVRPSTKGEAVLPTTPFIQDFTISMNNPALVPPEAIFQLEEASNAHNQFAPCGYGSPAGRIIDAASPSLYVSVFRSVDDLPDVGQRVVYNLVVNNKRTSTTYKYVQGPVAPGHHKSKWTSDFPHASSIKTAFSPCKNGLVVCSTAPLSKWRTFWEYKFNVLTEPQAVRAASQGNIDLAHLVEGLQVGELVLRARDLLLLKDQADTEQNGVYEIRDNSPNSNAIVARPTVVCYVIEGPCQGHVYDLVLSRTPVRLVEGMSGQHAVRPIVARLLYSCGPESPEYDFASARLVAMGDSCVVACADRLIFYSAQGPNVRIDNLSVRNLVADDVTVEILCVKMFGHTAACITRFGKILYLQAMDNSQRRAKLRRHSLSKDASTADMAFTQDGRHLVGCYTKADGSVAVWETSIHTDILKTTLRSRQNLAPVGKQVDCTVVFAGNDSFGIRYQNATLGDICEFSIETLQLINKVRVDQHVIWMESLPNRAFYASEFANQMFGSNTTMTPEQAFYKMQYDYQDTNQVPCFGMEDEEDDDDEDDDEEEEDEDDDQDEEHQQEEPQEE